MVDVVVREWLRQILGDEAAKSGYGILVESFLAIFYADDALVASRCPQQLQTAIDILVGLFERVGLHTNTLKTKTMVCVPGKIRVQLSPPMYASSREGLTTPRDRDKRRVKCDICGANLAAASLNNHLETQHNVYRSRVISQDLPVEGPPVVYQAHQSVFGKYECPVPDCIGKVETRYNLCQHFQVRHTNDLVSIAGEGFFPQCERCGMQVNPTATRHRFTKVCQLGHERKLQREAAANSAAALRQEFTVYGDVLERVEVFKYLGRLLAFDDTDTQAVRSNLKKAQG
jgi:hypothetical protein